MDHSGTAVNKTSGMEPTGTQWNLVNSGNPVEQQWNPVEPHGTQWNSMEFNGSGTQWCPSGIHWNNSGIT
eukprot:9117289-Karenia_brevis.AAC.1